MYDLGDKTVSKIKKYQLKDELQNEMGLNRYIDKILTEKAAEYRSKLLSDTELTEYGS